MHCESTFLLHKVSHLCPHVSPFAGYTCQILPVSKKQMEIKWHKYHTFRRTSTRIVLHHGSARIALTAPLRLTQCQCIEIVPRCIETLLTYKTGLKRWHQTFYTQSTHISHTLRIVAHRCASLRIEVCGRWTPIRWFGAKLSTVGVRCHDVLLWNDLRVVRWGRDLI